MIEKRRFNNDSVHSVGLAMSARVLVIGSGGREHAIAWKLSASTGVGRVYVTPGNPGTASLAKTENLHLNYNHHQEIVGWCVNSKIDLVVIGPEQPLADGLVDELVRNGIKCFGPSKKAAQIEASKDFAKSFMQRYSIPSARSETFNDVDSAKQHILKAAYPALVIKADGLAGGKGVIVATNADEACVAVDRIASLPAGARIVVEELLHGEEVSILAFCDGTTYRLMLPAQDHKRLLDGDRGPNTGGMGSYCPSDLLTPDDLISIHRDIFDKTLNGLRNEGIHYTGVLYAGLMVTKDGPKVLEFNCRFGDPEAEVILPLLQTDFYEILKACADGQLASIKSLEWEQSVAVGVVLCSQGYPGPSEKGFPIKGLEDVRPLRDSYVFHAGTSLDRGQLVTNGGRVLCVVSKGSTTKEAIAKVQHCVSKICFVGIQFRRDIGYQQLIRNVLKKGPLTYEEAGVSVDTASDFIGRIQSDVKRTKRSGASGTIGGFGAVFDLKACGYQDPLLVSGTDGVGTKLKIAQATGIHETIGIDLVAMCVNDVLAEGAEPLFFLDYLACGRLELDVASRLVAGVAEGCLIAGCALAGGETAEMPGVYPAGEYDLAGFAVGAVARDNVLPRKDLMTEGDVLIGLKSSGIHSNGFSLVRKIVERSGLDYSSPVPFDSNRTLGQSLLTPTRIYVKALLPVLRNGKVKGVAHITGGGFYENLLRMLPPHLAAELDATCWQIPPVFGWLAAVGQVSQREMLRTFNCGLGIVLAVGREDTDSVMKQLPVDVGATVVGRLRARTSEAEPGVKIHHFEWAIAPLMLPYVHHLVEKEVLQRKRVAVLISGSGSNLQALIERTNDPTLRNSARIVLVISNVAEAGGLQRARDAGIETLVVHHKGFARRLDFDMTLDAVLKEWSIDLVCLAGFMRILTPEMTSMWRGRLLNIHPALLPSFKGTHAVRQALEAGVKVTGSTVHFVEADVDAGAIIAQEPVAILPGDTEETLTQRIKEVEHRIYPEALEAVASGRVYLDGCGKCRQMR